MDKPIYAIRLADLRNKKGFTQQQLAEEINLTRGRLNNYEQGVREPDFKTLETLADFFDVTIDYLLGRTDEPQSHKDHKITTIAAHRTDDPTSKLPEDARKSIEDFKKFILEKHGIKYD